MTRGDGRGKFNGNRVALTPLMMVKKAWGSTVPPLARGCSVAGWQRLLADGLVSASPLRSSWVNIVIACIYFLNYYGH